MMCIERLLLFLGKCNCHISTFNPKKFSIVFSRFIKYNYFLPQGMAKRKRGSSKESSAKNISKSARKFVIPPLLKTEQIEVEVNVKPENDTPCTDSKSSITANNILFKCSGCGKSVNHHLGLGYRLVKTALLAEVGTQTGDESSDPEIQLEDSGMLGNIGFLEREIVVYSATSATSSIILSSDNGKFLPSHFHLLCFRFTLHTPCTQYHLTNFTCFRGGYHR